MMSCEDIIINEERSCFGIIDSHAHYFDRRFENEVEGGADAVIESRVFGKGIAAVINVGTNPENSIRCIEQAKKYKNMYAAVGVHPEDCQHLEGSVREELEKIRLLLDTPEKRAENKIVAIGEIGYDYYWQPVDRERQTAFFDGQLQMAREFSLPVIIHDREAHGDCFDRVMRHPETVGVFHSFSGSAEMAKELVKRGFYISFSGVLTFKNAARVRAVAESVPLERILIETDAPYLAPHPHRGELNHSGLMRYTAITLAEVKGITPDEAAEVTYNNACKLFLKKV